MRLEGHRQHQPLLCSARQREQDPDQTDLGWRGREIHTASSKAPFRWEQNIHGNCRGIWNQNLGKALQGRQRRISRNLSGCVSKCPNFAGTKSSTKTKTTHWFLQETRKVSPSEEMPLPEPFLGPHRVCSEDLFMVLLIQTASFKIHSAKINTKMLDESIFNPESICVNNPYASIFNLYSIFIYILYASIIIYAYIQSRSYMHQ